MKTFIRVAFTATLLAMASALTVSPASASVDMVVVHATGAPFARGTVIDGSLPLRLESGWSVTLAASDGTFVTLTGPSERVPAEAIRGGDGDPKIIEALGALLSARETSTAALGVVRSGRGNAEMTPPDPWAVSVERSGARCIPADVTRLWRHDSSKSIDLTITKKGGAKSAHARWAAGQETLMLDSSSFRDGANYTMTLEGRQVNLTIFVVPAAASGIVEQAAWMAQIGCDEQAIALLDNMR